MVKRLNQLWYIHTREYYSEIKNLDVARVLCSVKKSQSQKVTYYMIYFMYYRNDEILEMENRLVVARVKDGRGGVESKGQ